MTTVTITSADVGVTIAQNGVLSQIRFMISSREVFSNLALVDDAPPFDAVPRQLFNSDLLCFLTNRNGALQFPAGVLLDGKVAFGNLTVAACPRNAQFSIDCTGALAQRVADNMALARLTAGTVFSEQLKARAQQRLDEQVIANERIRTWSPPPTVAVQPPAPPLPRPIWMVEADREAEWLYAAQKDAAIKGPSLEQIKTETHIAARRRQAEAAANEEATAALYQRAETAKAALAKAQPEATVLLANRN
jgi:hypothetical protein